MQKYRDTVLDSAGNVVIGAVITVNITGGGAAVIYSDNGVTVVASVTSAADGSFSFYAANGRYTITVVPPASTGLPTVIVSDILLEDNIVGNAVQTFSVGTAVSNAHAVRLDQVNATTNAIGYVVESVAGATNAPATATWGDLTSLVNLPAGTWDISMIAGCVLNASTITGIQAGIGTASGTGTTGLSFGNTQGEALPPNSVVGAMITIPPKRYSSPVPVTIYLKMYAVYSAGTPLFYGRITAVRVALPVLV